MAPDVEAPRPEPVCKCRAGEAVKRRLETDGDRGGIYGEVHGGAGYTIVTLRHMVITFRVLLCATALAAASCARPDASSDRASVADTQRPVQAVKPAGVPRVVFLGDSLTAGYGLAREQSVPSLIQAHLNSAGYRYEVINAGVSGDTSAGGLSRLDWSLDGDVDVLVVELGANDGLRGLPVSEMKRNLADIITRAKTRGITVILTGMEAPPNYGAAYTTEFRQVFRELAREQKVAFIPFYLEGVAGNPSLNISDGIHPNPAGARIVEQTIWRALEPLLEKSDR
jgi:acyl-CoA thioesterase-1